MILNWFLDKEFLFRNGAAAPNPSVYRAFNFRKSLAGAGYDIRIHWVTPGAAGQEPAMDDTGSACIVSASLLPDAPWLVWVMGLEKRQVFIDTGPEDLAGLIRSGNMHLFASMPLVWIAGHLRVKEHLLMQWGIRSRYLPSPVPSPPLWRRPVSNDTPGFKLLWFRDIVNIDYFLAEISDLRLLHIPVSVHLVSNMREQHHDMVRQAGEGHIRFSFSNWEAFDFHAIHRADACHISALFPHSQNRFVFRTATHALTGGIPVISRPYPLLNLLMPFCTEDKDAESRMAFFSDIADRPFVTDTAPGPVRSMFSIDSIRTKFSRIFSPKVKHPAPGIKTVRPPPIECDPVIVIGMHRSGTSLLARLLNRLGCFLGGDLDGLYESRLFLTINEAILTHNRLSWDRPTGIQNLAREGYHRQFTLNWMAAVLKSRARLDYLGQAYGAAYGDISSLPLRWGWKDPRTTFLLPLWMSLFPGARVIHIVRNGIDVSASLRNRHWRIMDKLGLGTKWRLAEGTEPFTFNGIRYTHRCDTLSGCFSLWEEYVSEGRKHLINLGEKSLEVQYEHLLSHPGRTLNRIARFCDIPIVENRIREAESIIDSNRPPIQYTGDEELSEFAEYVGWSQHRYAAP